MELVDLYNEERIPLGKSVERYAQRRRKDSGEYRVVVHICIFNSAGEMLLQQRSMKKDAFPGMWDVSAAGGIRAGENSRQGAEREVREELGLTVSCGELLFVVEGVAGEAFHRVDLVFACDYLSEAPGASLHTDTNQVGVEWLDVEKLLHTPLYPSRLRRQIMNYAHGLPHKVYLGNENAGDPEYLD